MSTATTPRRRITDCSEDCSMHNVFEEKLKIVDTIPEIVEWMNKEKGSRAAFRWATGIFLAIILSIFGTMIIDMKNDISHRQFLHEQIIRDSSEKMAKQIDTIVQSVGELKTSVAVIARTTEVHEKQYQRQLDNKGMK